MDEKALAELQALAPMGIFNLVKVQALLRLKSFMLKALMEILRIMRSSTPAITLLQSPVQNMSAVSPDRFMWLLLRRAAIILVHWTEVSIPALFSARLTERIILPL